MIQEFTASQLLPFAVSFLLFLISILLFLKEKASLSLLFIVLGSVCLGISLTLLDPYLGTWDEQFHALVGKNLTKDFLHPTLYDRPIFDYDYKNWTANHTWLHKQPLFLWQIALSIKLLGANVLAVRLPSILAHAITSIFLYRIGKIAFNRNTGFIAALLFALAFYPLELITNKYATDHNDLMFLFYCTASIWSFCEYSVNENKWWLILVGLFSGMAILVKWLTGLLVYAVWFFHSLFSNKLGNLFFEILRMVPSMLITFLTFLPWQFYILSEFPRESAHEFSYNTEHFFDPVEGHRGDFLYHITEIPTIWGLGNISFVVVSLGILAIFIFAKSKGIKAALAASIFTVYLFYSVAATKMTSFTIIAFPFILVGVSAGLSWLVQLLEKLNKTVYKSVFFIVLCVCGYFCFNINLMADHHSPKRSETNYNRSMELMELDAIMKIDQSLNSRNLVIFNANITTHSHIAFMFHSSCVAYPFHPSQEDIEMVKARGMKPAIFSLDSQGNYSINDDSVLKLIYSRESGELTVK
jgi:4-amino-4-deoxy-L-arabinose transferase-like glycosyltransferase